MERRGRHRPRRPGPARLRDAAHLLADRLPGLRAGHPGLQQLLPVDGAAGARARLPRRLVLGQRRRLQGPGAARGHPALLPRDGRPVVHVVADHRPQPVLDEHLPHVQPGPALLDPGPQRRDQHDRPAARAERAARPADDPRRIRQPGPQPPARGADLREGPLPPGGRRVRPAADPRRGPPPAGQAAGPLRPLPRGPRAVRAGPRGPGVPRRRRDGVRGRRDGPASPVVGRDRGVLRRLVRARRGPGRRPHHRPRPARPRREGGPGHGRRRRPARPGLPGAPARGVRPRQEPGRAAHGRGPGPSGRRPRPGRGGGVPGRGAGRPRSRARPAARLRRLDRERQAAAPVPRRPRRRADRLAGLGRPAGPVHAGADAPVGLPAGDRRGRHQPGDRPRARGGALLHPRGAGPQAPDPGSRARPAAALRAAHADHPRRHARRGGDPLAARAAARRRRARRGLHGGRAGRVGLAGDPPAAELLDGPERARAPRPARRGGRGRRAGGRRADRAPRPQRRPGRARLRPPPRGGGRRQGAARGPQGGRLLVAPRRQPGAAGRRHPQRPRRDGRARLRRPGAVPLRDDGEGDGRLARALRRRQQRPRRPPEGHREGALHAGHPRAARLRAPGVGHRGLPRGPRHPRDPGLLRLGGTRPRPGRRGRPRRAGTPDPRRRGEPLQGEAPAHVPQGLEGPGAGGHLRAGLRGVRRDPGPPRGRAAGGHPARGAAAAGRGDGPRAGRRGQLAGGRAHPPLPHQLDELRQPGRGGLPLVRRGGRPRRHALDERRGRRDPRHVRALPQAPRPADRQRALRRLGPAHQLLGVGGDQDRPGRQARRGRPPAGVQGDPGDRPGAQRPGGQRPDQPLEQPRPLLDRGPGPAHRRAQDVQPARQGDRQGPGGPGHRHDRHRHRQGGRGRDHALGLRRGHRRRAPARPAPRRAAL